MCGTWWSACSDTSHCCVDGYVCCVEVPRATDFGLPLWLSLVLLIWYVSGMYATVVVVLWWGGNFLCCGSRVYSFYSKFPSIYQALAFQCFRWSIQFKQDFVKCISLTFNTTPITFCLVILFLISKCFFSKTYLNNKLSSQGSMWRTENKFWAKWLVMLLVKTFQTSAIFYEKWNHETMSFCHYAVS